MIIQVYTRTFLSSSSPPLYVKPSYFHPYFSLQTAQQFTESLDRMLSTPDTSLITSQGTPRPPWPKMVSELWLLPSTVYLPSMYEEEKVLRFSMQRKHRFFKKKGIFIFFYKRIQDYFATLMIISIALSSTASNSSMSSSSFSLS